MGEILTAAGKNVEVSESNFDTDVAMSNLAVGDSALVRIDFQMHHRYVYVEKISKTQYKVDGEIRSSNPFQGDVYSDRNGVKWGANGVITIGNTGNTANI
jgi:hypothetical protein